MRGMLFTIGNLFAAIQMNVLLATRVTFLNQCTHDVHLYDNSATEILSVGTSTSRDLVNGFSGMFRDGTSAEATLAQFAISGGKTWYAISTVPPGAGSCTSYVECAATSSKTGYNVAMRIIPDMTNLVVNAECAIVSCNRADCQGAYLYPSDNSKLHNCPDSLALQVIFCPDELNAVTPAVELPTPAPTSDVPVQCTSPPRDTLPPVSPSTNSTVYRVTGDFSNATIRSSFVYSGLNAGAAAGSYEKVTDLGTCTTENVAIQDPVGPMSEEVSMVFRGPLNLYNVAVFTGSPGNEWVKVSSYDAHAGIQDNMVVMSNLNIDYTGAQSSPQGYATADGTATATDPTVFGGWLADAADPSVLGGGPCVSTGCEVNILAATKCADKDGCIGYYDDLGYHGWDGGMKTFVTRVQMPTGPTVNLPAIWLLNAQVVRANQYGCNCRGSGAHGGCGEIDVAEVVETTPGQDKVSTHYYFYDGSVSPGADNYAMRPTDAPVTYVTIFDNASEGLVKIIELGSDDFNFTVDAVTAKTVTAWLATPVKNLLS